MTSHMFIDISSSIGSSTHIVEHDRYYVPSGYGPQLRFFHCGCDKLRVCISSCTCLSFRSFFFHFPGIYKTRHLRCLSMSRVYRFWLLRAATVSMLRAGIFSSSFTLTVLLLHVTSYFALFPQAPVLSRHYKHSLAISSIDPRFPHAPIQPIETKNSTSSHGKKFPGNPPR